MGLTTTWLGQSGLLFEAGGQSVVVDPWPSPHPARAIDPAPPEKWPAEIELVLITHGHGDQLDLDGLAALSRESKLLMLVSVRPGVATANGVRVFPAWHAMIAPDGTTPHLGYGLWIGDLNVYVSGDTISDPKLIAAVRPFEPDIAFLPVNGQDEVARPGTSSATWNPTKPSRLLTPSAPRFWFPSITMASPGKQRTSAR